MERGSLYLSTEDSRDEVYYSDDRQNFFRESADQKLSYDDCQNWAVCLISPWGQHDERYVIEINCKDNYTSRNDEDPLWRCRYTVIGYEGITSSVIGYGDTEIEALQDCKELLEYLQKTYNPDREHF